MQTAEKDILWQAEGHKWENLRWNRAVMVMILQMPLRHFHHKTNKKNAEPEPTLQNSVTRKIYGRSRGAAF